MDLPAPKYCIPDMKLNHITATLSELENVMSHEADQQGLTPYSAMPT